MPRPTSHSREEIAVEFEPNVRNHIERPGNEVCWTFEWLINDSVRKQTLAEAALLAQSQPLREIV